MKSPAFKNQPGNSSLVWDYSPALPGTARFGRCAAGASVVGHRTHSSHVCLPSPASAVLGRCLRHRCRRTVLHTCTCGTPSCVRCRTGARVPVVPWTAKDAVQCRLAHEYLRYLRRQAGSAGNDNFRLYESCNIRSLRSGRSRHTIRRKIELVVEIVLHAAGRG